MLALTWPLLPGARQAFHLLSLIGPGVGGFLPAVKQIGNVAALPGIVHVSPGSPQPSTTCQSPLTSSVSLQKSIGLPDVHSGYGFAIGNMAAFDMSDPAAVVSPGSCSLFRPLTPDPDPAEPRL